MLQKIWESHVVDSDPLGRDLLFIDMHLLHEVTSPQAFEALRLAGRRVRRPDLSIATADHSVPTRGRHEGWDDELAFLQVETVRKNAMEAGIRFFGIDDPRQGVIHVIAPEQGLVLPGMTVVCGDSHTATHGALGALAFGIGTSEVEHVLATQTLPARLPSSMAFSIEGELPLGVTAKDMALAVIRRLGVHGGTGYAIEFMGAAVRGLDMEGRLTLCNMAIEAGARSGMVAPDEITFRYLKGRPFSPAGAAWDEAVGSWKRLVTDKGASFSCSVDMDASSLEPLVTWGTSPEQSVELTGSVPAPEIEPDEARRRQMERALAYMGLKPGTRLRDVPVNWVFIGSCTNGRIGDLRAAANLLKGRKVANGVRVLVVPGSGLVKRQAEDEGLAQIFTEAGCEWRDPGCSMCLGMNPDVAGPGERSASTSNRNFEGRQGRGARTHLVSPLAAAASAITGRLTDPRELIQYVP
jgi:3-isopropylmalate/(R)-2-methylmalate dehydratase large subunit